MGILILRPLSRNYNGDPNIKAFKIGIIMGILILRPLNRDYSGNPNIKALKGGG